MASTQARGRVADLAKCYEDRILRAWGVRASDVASQLAKEESGSSPSSIAMLRRLASLCELESDLGIVQAVLSAQCHKRAEAYGRDENKSDSHRFTVGDVDSTIAVFQNRAASSSVKPRLQTNGGNRSSPSTDDCDLCNSGSYNAGNRFQHLDLVLGLSKKRFTPDVPNEAVEEGPKKRRITGNVNRSGKPRCLLSSDFHFLFTLENISTNHYNADFHRT